MAGITPRHLLWVITVLGLTAVTGSLVSEHAFAWRPCYLCITQRFGYALVALLGVLGLAWPRTSRLVAGGAGLVGVAGAAAAAYQVKVQSGGATSTCSGSEMQWLEQSVEFMAATFGRFFEVTGFCSESYKLLGLIPLVPLSLGLFLAVTAAAAKIVFAVEEPAKR